MSDLAFTRNPVNGLMEFTWDATGDVVFDETEQHAVCAALVVVQAAWAADTAGQLGSQLTEVKNLDETTTPSQVEAYVRSGLAPLVAAGRITIVQVTVDLPDGALDGRIDVAVYWAVPGNPNQTQVARTYF